jgi:hypothetical protein
MGCVCGRRPTKKDVKPNTYTEAYKAGFADATAQITSLIESNAQRLLDKEDINPYKLTYVSDTSPPLTVDNLLLTNTTFPRSQDK